MTAHNVLIAVACWLLVNVFLIVFLMVEARLPREITDVDEFIAACERERL
jgi:hypothetical protein